MHGHVLVVDDDEDTRVSVGVILEVSGYAVELAADGSDALARLARRPLPCLVLLDLMMPRMNGWELRQRMLEDPELARVPVLIVSGAADLDDETSRLGVIDCVPKPVDVDRLLDVVRTHC